MDDLSCAWDCFGAATCDDGRVTVWEHAFVPCYYWTGDCPSYTALMCDRGCAVAHASGWFPPEGEEQDGGPFSDPRDLCAESQPTPDGAP